MKEDRGVLLHIETNHRWQALYLESLIKAMGRRNFTLFYAAALRTERRLRQETGEDYFDLLLQEAIARADLALKGPKKGSG